MEHDTEANRNIEIHLVVFSFLQRLKQQGNVTRRRSMAGYFIISLLVVK